MKIEWIVNGTDDLSEAIVTRGWLFKRRAHLYRSIESQSINYPGDRIWKHMTTNRWSGISAKMEKARNKILDRRFNLKEWTSQRSALPKARLLK